MHYLKEQKTKKYSKSCTIQHLWDETYNRHYNFLDLRNVCCSVPKKLMERRIHLISLQISYNIFPAAISIPCSLLLKRMWCVRILIKPKI